MGKQILVLSIVGLFLVSTITLTFAQIPRVINYQGIIFGLDERSIPEGHYDLTFRIYDEGNNLLWTEVYNQWFVAGGMVHVILGSVNPLNLPFDRPYLLGIQVGNDPELQPRIPLTSVPYSIKAEDANTVAGIRASDAPEPHVLFPLGNDGKFPPSVLPAATSGNYLKKGEPDTSRGNSNDPMLLISNLGNGDGFNGRSTYGNGISGRSENSDGVFGVTAANDKSGVFGHSENGIGVSGRSVNHYGVLARSDNSHSIYVPGSGGQGVKIENAGLNGIDVVNANHEGVLVRAAGRDGIMVGSANWSGIYVADANFDAIRVQKAGQDGLHIFETVGRNYIRLGSDADPEFIFEKGGIAYADSAWFASGDFAELIEADGSVSSYEPGDLLVISDDKDRTVTLSSEPYSTSIIGVYSTKPGFIGSAHPRKGRLENEIPVAITGIVPCKVSTENGSIRRGDLLTTSNTPGYAMKATEPKVGTILGKALESLENGMGKIEVLIILQ